MSILVHKPGILASLQDKGRWGYQHVGIPVGGAMDLTSMQLANTICGNDPDTAVLEFTLQGAMVEFEQAISFAICGGGASLTLDNVKIDFGQRITAPAGSILKWHPHPYGCRTYMAVENGFSSMAELGSCSTYPLAQLGGINGNYLQAGDRIPFHKNSRKENLLESNKKNTAPDVKAATVTVTFSNAALTTNHVAIKCYPGPEWDWFSGEAQERFTNETWKVGLNANRMGYSLNGPELKKNCTQELISTAVTKGIVQVTPAGMPLVLMADAQTIGGYPRIARIAESDLAILAQCRPGYQLNFQLQPTLHATHH
ncbi:MAG: biotin-dependent carboxyltransferase family protein [Sphingomonadales bacterium]